MKKVVLFLGSALVLLVAGTGNGCKKDTDPPNPNSLKEEFDDVTSLSQKGWLFTNNSTPPGIASWQQGFNGVGKGGPSGFSAYSYKNYSIEYVYVGNYYGSPNTIISSWMITPPLDIKNGDRLSFYTRAESISGFADRLQVRLNMEDNTVDVGSSATSVGKFTTILKDINESLVVDGYPKAWTKYEVTISGLSAAKQARIAFRYCPEGGMSSGIGVDLFEFTSL